MMYLKFTRFLNARSKQLRLKFLLLLGLALLAGAAKLSAEEPDTTTKKEPSAKVGRAQLWEQNCARCHNLRSPSSYSDAKWDVIVTHMRIRAYLTAEEAQSIVEFLKAGN